MNIHIRKVELSDIDCLTQYRIEYLAELLGVSEGVDMETVQKELADYFRHSIANGNFVGMIAENEGIPVAFGGMVIKYIPGDFSQSSYSEADILNMYTIPSARRQGISTAILHALKDKAIKMGISKLALHTSKAGEQVYRNFGFHDPVYPVLELPL
jgi:GNAT superfamily N-acetyltransferase